MLSVIMLSIVCAKYQVFSAMPSVVMFSVVYDKYHIFMLP